MTETTRGEIKLGELLQALGIVGSSQLADSVKLAVQVGLPLGRALVLSAHVSEEDLDCALEIQSLIRQQGLPLAVAIKAFNISREQTLPLHKGLELAGWDKVASGDVLPSRLGSLLFDAKFISREQLDEAQKTSYETGLPLGRMLCMMGMIKPDLLTKALDLQRLIRDGSMSHNQAVLALNSSGRPDLDMALRSQGIDQRLGRKPIRLGELLMLSGILTESDIMNAIEQALTTNRTLGDILVEMGLIARPVLNLALELQQSICDGQLSLNAATDTLHYVASTGDTMVNPETPPEPPKGESVRLGELLKMCGLIVEEDIQQAIDLSSKYPSLIGKMLVVSGAIDEATLLSALRCQFLLRNGHITLDQAIQALKYAKHRHLSLDDSLEELGLEIPTPPRGGTTMANQ